MTTGLAQHWAIAPRGTIPAQGLERCIRERTDPWPPTWPEFRQLYRYYVARFQSEFLFHDSKQFAGLTHCQARHPEALTFHTEASLTAVSFTTLQMAPTLGHLPLPFSRARVAHRAFNEPLLQRLLAHLADGGRLAENSPADETFGNDGLISPIAACKLSKHGSK